MEGTTSSTWQARTNNLSRQFLRLINRIVYSARQNSAKVIVALILLSTTLAGYILLSANSSPVNDVELQNNQINSPSQLRSLRKINSFLNEYVRGPREILDMSTVDSEHLHGRVNVDLSTGLPLWSVQPLTFRMTPEQKTEAHRGYCFNTRVSKSIPLDRSIPDFNSDDCRDFDYSRFDLPTSDVVIVFHNEDLSVLLRSVVSILDRTPPELLNEIILFNDDSNRTSHPWLFEELPEFVKNTVKTRLIHSSKRQGLMMARVHASKVSEGDDGAPILVYLDSHIECSKKWLEPMVIEIWQDYRTVVTPMIHTIRADDLVFEKNALGVLSFSWSLGQTHPNKQREETSFVGPVAPFISPVMAGGLFAASRKWFIDELEGYDPEMRLYGGEEMEIGFKTWMCGGRLLNSPCSHIGHIFRTDKFWKGQVYKVPMGEISRNKRRVAEVWLDEYLEIFNEVVGGGGAPGGGGSPTDLAVGDLTHQRWLREEKLKCKSFKWFLSNIAKDIWVPDLKRSRKGYLFNHRNGICLDNLQADLWGSAGPYSCHYQKGSQSFLLDQGQLRIGGTGYKFCIIPKDKRLEITTCPERDDAKANGWKFEVKSDAAQVRARESENLVPVGLMRYENECLALTVKSGTMRECDSSDQDQLLAWSG